MTAQDDREKIKPLLVKKEERLEDLVSLARPFIGLDEDTGEVVFLKDPGELKQEQSVFLAILGRYLASRGGLVETDTIKVSEISELLGMQRKVVSARLVDLKSANAVSSPSRGEYMTNVAAAKRYLKQMKKGGK